MKKRYGKDLMLFRTGYKPTSNNQSFSQEFEEGKVHRSIEKHMSKKKVPKCSRTPIDAFTLYGGKYQANPGARRGALAWAIDNAYRSKPNGFKYGANIIYKPNPHFVYNKMQRAARLAVK